VLKARTKRIQEKNNDIDHWQVTAHVYYNGKKYMSIKQGNTLRGIRPDLKTQVSFYRSAV